MLGGRLAEQGIGFLAILLFFCGFCILCVSADENTTEKTGTTLYVVIPTSGDLETKGVSSHAALTMAVDDMNALLTSIGSDTSIRLEITETTSDPQSALEAVQKLHDAGVHMVLGYFTSAHLEAIREYVDENDMLILSAGSSAPSVAIADDNILRFNPDDRLQGEALTAFLKEEGIADIVLLVRDDVWGDDLMTAVHENLANDTTLEDVVRYTPGEVSFNKTLVSLDNEVGKVLKLEDAKAVGVLAITFGEISQIMEEASHPEYANLSAVRWFGVDGNVLDANLAATPAAAAFAAERKFTGTIYFPNLNSIQSSTVARLTKELGYEPDGYAYALYDMAKIASGSYALRGAEDARSLKQAVTYISSSYKGITGDMILNEAGDRSEGTYAYWIFEQDEKGAGTWKNLGGFYKWESDSPGEIELNQE